MKLLNSLEMYAFLSLFAAFIPVTPSIPITAYGADKGSDHPFTILKRAGQETRLLSQLTFELICPCREMEVGHRGVKLEPVRRLSIRDDLGRQYRRYDYDLKVEGVIAVLEALLAAKWTHVPSKGECGASIQSGIRGFSPISKARLRAEPICAKVMEAARKAGKEWRTGAEIRAYGPPDVKQEAKDRLSWEHRLARINEILVQQAIAGGLDPDRAKHMREILTRKLKTRFSVFEAYRTGKIGREEMVQQARAAKKDAQEALRRLLTPKELASLDEEEARFQVFLEEKGKQRGQPRARVPGTKESSDEPSSR
jgi:hypothetical protein